jgi:hypothetical protein
MTKEEALERIRIKLDEAVDDAEVMNNEDYEMLQFCEQILSAKPCEDAVSRQDLYNALYERFHNEDSPNNTTEVRFGAVRNFVKDFPSVIYTQRWIPVNERLPKIGSTVLIQFVNSSNGISMDDYGSCELSWLRDGELWLTNSGTFKESEILAWMPLPQSYKAKIKQDQEKR